jgi:hypothetical protein
MSDSPNFLPHLPLRLAREGNASLHGGGPGKSERSIKNTNDIHGHGSRLSNAASTMVANWQAACAEREKANKPTLPNAVSFILHVDPKSFNADDLKGFGIEVIADLEGGYIIGASADIGLSELRKKIQKFINSAQGGGKIPEIWEILEGTRRPEYILSPGLQAQWDKILEQQEYVVDVGISCIDVREQYSRCPKRERFEDERKFQESVDRWLDKHHLLPEEWSDLHRVREEQFEQFIYKYSGRLLTSVMGNDVGFFRLPDSFSCRICIRGAGLKDLVLNFPYIFDVSEPDDFGEATIITNGSEAYDRDCVLISPPSNAPRVCVIDSGVQENHPKLRNAIDSDHSRSWVPGELDLTSDYVDGGGHGTRAAGAILYPQGIPQIHSQQAICWLQNARVLGKDNFLPKGLFLPVALEEIVDFYYTRTSTRIYNQSIAGITPCLTQTMSPWASAIDKLSWEKDVLFIVAAGNIEPRASFVTRPSISNHLKNGRPYPDYLLSPSARVANPAQSFQALTVGSIAHTSYSNSSLRSIAQENHPSSFSCSGPGIWDVIKPEVVEYGGDYVIDSDQYPNFTTPEETCPELVRSTLNNGKGVASDVVGTSFATPKVTHIVAALAAAFPNESTLLYRALVIQSARLPSWANESPDKLYHAIRMMGYGLPNLDRALGNTPNRVTLKTEGKDRISTRQAKVYQVQVPRELLNPGKELDILVEITLSYAAEPRRTRRDRRKYLSTWLDWTCSKPGQDPDTFLDNILKEYNSSEDAEKGEGTFAWTLGKKKKSKEGSSKGASNSGIDGVVKDLSRSSGTIQKDWAIVKSFELREGFCIAVVAHEGWNKRLEADAPFALTVSFEVVGAEIPIYGSFAEAQVDLIEPPINIQVQQSVTI